MCLWQVCRTLEVTNAWVRECEDQSVRYEGKTRGLQEEVLVSFILETDLVWVPGGSREQNSRVLGFRVCRAIRTHSCSLAGTYQLHSRNEGEGVPSEGRVYNEQIHPARECGNRLSMWSQVLVRNRIDLLEWGWEARDLRSGQWEAQLQVGTGEWRPAEDPGRGGWLYLALHRQCEGQEGLLQILCPPCTQQVPPLQDEWWHHSDRRWTKEPCGGKWQFQGC